MKMTSLLRGSLRQRIMASVGAMVILSLLGSVSSLYRMTEVNRLMNAINHVSVPLGRLFTQMQSDAEVLHREMERSLGYSHWKDPHWRPRPAPVWIEDVLNNEMSKVQELIRSEANWANPEAREHWRQWVGSISSELAILSHQATDLYQALESKDEASATEIYLKWASSIDKWKRQLQWGAQEYERFLRQSFSAAEKQVSDLRTGLELILVIVVLMSLLLLWLGERALRPLSELTRLAREITRRGLRKEDKSLLPNVPLTRSDEVSQLAREFHNMATALLERELMIESQKNRVQEQNRLLREMGRMNQNILNSIESVLIVTDLNGVVTQCNPGALRWLSLTESQMMGSHLMNWEKIQPFVNESSPDVFWLERLRKTAETWKLGPLSVGSPIYGGYIMPLRKESGDAYGAIFVLDDLTEELDLQDRLRRAENFAAVGRLSAQVAHEVRNPLHSIGLEAEMAAERASELGSEDLKQSLYSILNSVDRLQKITENYLKLSRLSDGQKAVIDLGVVLESVLVTYSPVCEVQSVQVDWITQEGSDLRVWADKDLLEQVLGNLFRNALQALENWVSTTGEQHRISWMLGNRGQSSVFLRIEDNGPGIAKSIKDKLFTPFVTTRVQGTGLGLSFVKKVIEDQGGQIQCFESSARTGACFEIELPLADSQSRQPTVPATSEVLYEAIYES